ARWQSDRDLLLLGLRTPCPVAATPMTRDRGPGHAGAMRGVSCGAAGGGDTGRVLKGTGQHGWLGDGVGQRGGVGAGRRVYNASVQTPHSSKGGPAMGNAESVVREMIDAINRDDM